MSSYRIPCNQVKEKINILWLRHNAFQSTSLYQTAALCNIELPSNIFNNTLLITQKISFSEFSELKILHFASFFRGRTWNFSKILELKHDDIHWSSQTSVTYRVGALVVIGMLRLQTMADRWRDKVERRKLSNCSSSSNFSTSQTSGKDDITSNGSSCWVEFSQK